MDYSKRIERIEKKLAALGSELFELKQDMQRETSRKSEAPYSAVRAAQLRQQEPLDAAKAGGERQEVLVSVSGEQKLPDKPLSLKAGKEQQAGSGKDRQEVPVSAGREQKLPDKPLSLEEKIGGRLMGIVAAVLVFIGLILFGTIIYEKLGATARVALLFLVSAALLGAGIRLHRRRRSWFSLSLTGCGFGALYLSLFMTRVVFGLVSVEGLYGLLLFWFVGIGLFVWKYHSQVVSFLGLVGISMSVLFGAAFLEDENQYIFLVFYFLVMSSLYLWMILGRFLPQTKKERYPKLFLAAMFAQIVQGVALAFCFKRWYRAAGQFGLGFFICLLFSIFALVLPVLYHMREHLQMGIPALFPAGIRRAPAVEGRENPAEAASHWMIFGWYQVLSGIMLALFWTELCVGGDIVPLLGYALFSLFFAGIWAVTEILDSTGTEGMASSVITAIGLAMAGADLDRFVFAAFFVGYAALFLLAGFFTRTRKKEEFRMEGLPRAGEREKDGYGKLPEKLISLVLLMIPFFMGADGMKPETAFTLFAICSMGLLVLFFVFLLLGKKKEYGVLYHQEHADGLKCACFLLFLLVFGFFCGWETEHIFVPEDDILSLTVMLVALVVVNGAAFYGRLCKKLYEPECGDRRMTIVTFAVNQILWIFGMLLLHSGATPNHPGCFVLLLLVTLYLCVSGMKRGYLRYADRTEFGIYLGLRVTIYVLVVLGVFGEIPGVGISCVLLLVALGAVIAGFRFRLKSLRLYGLVLTMLAVLKLLMLDVRHDNSLETVGCFLIAGILCFCINLVYNKVKKYMEE